MDLSEAKNQQNLGFIPLRWFYIALGYSLSGSSDHPLEMLQYLCENGLQLYPAEINEEKVVEAIDERIVVATLQNAWEEMWHSDLDDLVFLRSITFENNSPNEIENPINFYDIWVVREEVRQTHRNLGVDGFPWPRVHLPRSASDWGWFPTNAEMSSDTVTQKGKNSLPTKDRSHHAEPQESDSMSEMATSQKNRFFLAGDYWNVTFNGETSTIKNTKGLRYIAWLIRNQGKEIDIRELYYAINPLEIEITDPTHSGMTSHQLEKEGLAPDNLGYKEELIDQKTKQDIEKRIRAIENEASIAEETGNSARLSKLEDEKSKIAQYLSASLGIGGRPREFSNEQKKILDSVKKCIRGDIYKIGTHLPALAEHLKSINLASNLSYNPNPTVDWEVKSTNKIQRPKKS